MGRSHYAHSCGVNAAGAQPLQVRPPSSATRSTLHCKPMRVASVLTRANIAAAGAQPSALHLRRPYSPVLTPVRIKIISMLRAHNLCKVRPLICNYLGCICGAVTLVRNMMRAPPQTIAYSAILTRCGARCRTTSCRFDPLITCSRLGVLYRGLRDWLSR
jgi:hypothetical protein